MVICHTKKGKVLSIESKRSKAEEKSKTRVFGQSSMEKCMNGGRNGSSKCTQRLRGIGGWETEASENTQSW